MDKLTRHWYNVLQKDGFEDIETYKGEMHLKQWSRLFNTKNMGCNKAEYFRLKQDYYYYATHFATEFKFGNAINQTIWKMHSEGVGVRDIAAALLKYRQRLYFEPNKDNVHKIIKSLKVEFLKYWQSQRDKQLTDYGVEL